MHGITRHLATAISMALLSTAVPGHAQTAQIKAKVSKDLPHYAPKVDIKGELEIPGTDALTDLGEQWGHLFTLAHPGAKVVYFPKLTKATVKDLTDGVRPMIITAREMTGDETKAFQAKFGYMPMRIPVCLDATIIFVNKNNPISSISMEQLDAIYSQDRLGGAKKQAATWGDLSADGELRQRAINAYARGESTATSVAFRNIVLLNGAFRSGILEREDSSALAEAIMTDETGIAYSSLASWYPGLKVLPVVPYHATDARVPNQENINSSKYPLPRLYYAYVNRSPGQALSPFVNELLHLILSQEGQSAAAELGILPAPTEFLTIALKRLDR